MSDTDEYTDGTDRPEDWPDTFSLAGEDPSCPHAMTWDSAEVRYVCIHGCGRTEDEPPESSIEVYRKFLEKKEQRSRDTGSDQKGGSE